MKTLRGLQLQTEAMYGHEARTFFHKDIPLGAFETPQISKAVYDLLLTSTGDILIQNAISYLLRSMGEKPSSETIGKALAIFESQAFTDLAEVHCIEGGHAYIKSKINLSKEAAERLNTAMYLPPMLVPPLPWTDFASGGYLTERLPVITKWKNRHNGYLNYAALNAAQRTQYTIDGFILTRFGNPTPPAKRQRFEEIATYALLLGRPFHYVWQYDSRGRMYSHGYHMDVQSTEYKRALHNFAKTELLTKEGEQELFYALAEAGGQRRKTFAEQVECGEMFYEMFEPDYIADGSVDLDDAFFEAYGVKERISFTKYLKALLEHFVDGVETGVMISRDATASGIQISAALSGCPVTAELANLTSTIRNCPYTHVLGVMDTRLGEGQGIDREVGKNCLMTHYYCSISTPEKSLTPTQLGTFYDVIGGIFKGPELVMAAVVDAWDDLDTFAWTLPNGHRANVKRSVVHAVDIEWHGAQFPYEFSVHAPDGNYRHLVANIIQGFDGYIAQEMQLMAEYQGFDIASNHDSFATHPNHSRKALRNYQTIMQGICDNNYLQDVLREITGNPDLVFNKISEGMKVTSEYCICS